MDMFRVLVSIMLVGFMFSIFWGLMLEQRRVELRVKKMQAEEKKHSDRRSINIIIKD